MKFIAYGVSGPENRRVVAENQTTHQWVLKQIIIEVDESGIPYHSFGTAAVIAKNKAEEHNIELLGLVRCDGQFPLRCDFNLPREPLVLESAIQ